MKKSIGLAYVMGVIYATNLCSKCNGWGSINEKICPSCKGTGRNCKNGAC